MRKIFFLLSFFMLATAARSQEVLSIGQVRQMALDNNHKAKDAALTIQIAEQAVRQYRANYFPDISLSGFAAYGISKQTLFEAPLSKYSPLVSMLLKQPTQIPDVKIDWELGWILNGGITLKQPLFMGGRIVAANRIAKHSLNMARLGKQLTDAEIIEIADEAYINVVRSDELFSVATKYLDLLTELERNVQSAVEIGLKMPADLLRVQVKKNEVTLQLRRAENANQLAQMNLNHVIGRPLGTAVTVAGLDSIASQTGRIEAAERPETGILREQVEIARQQVRIARADMLPSLALIANYGYSDGVKLAGKKLLDGASFLGGVTLNIPIYHFGERQAKLRQAKLRMEQAQNRFDDVEEQLQLALVKAQNEVNEAALELELSQRGLQQAELSMKTTQRQYENGMATLSDLLDAQAQWQKAYETRIEAYCHQHTAHTALMRAMGTLESRE